MCYLTSRSHDWNKQSNTWPAKSRPFWLIFLTLWTFHVATKFARSCWMAGRKTTTMDVAHLSIRDALNHMGTRGTPE
jgi:hypothetical protein